MDDDFFIKNPESHLGNKAASAKNGADQTE